MIKAERGGEKKRRGEEGGRRKRGKGKRKEAANMDNRERGNTLRTAHKIQNKNMVTGVANSAVEPTLHKIFFSLM